MTTEDSTLQYSVALSMLKGVGPRISKKLLQAFGSAEKVFSESIKQQTKLTIPRTILDQLRSNETLEMADKELIYARKHGISVLSYLDSGYPKRLKDCPDAPIVLYLKGKGEVNPNRALSIVGTRRSTNYGKLSTAKIVGGLSVGNVQIVSGLASGIDTAAHLAALDNGMSTVAVLGHALDRIYPRSNTKTAEKILEQGLLVTEFATSSEFLPGNFPARNRIIAGWSNATLVVESNKTGGSMITAELAVSYFRDVFAVPGPIHAEFSSGCNLLIKNNSAALIDSAQDIIDAMGWTEVKRPSQMHLFSTLSKEESKIVEFLKDSGPQRAEDIVKNVNLSVGKVAGILLDLELKSAVHSIPGNRFTASL